MLAVPAPAAEVNTVVAPRRFALVDAARGIASLWVVFFHAHEGRHLAGLAAVWPNWATLPFRAGWVGVPIFFVLSGYVISHSVGKHKVDGGFVWRFALRRSIRLDPPYWASMVITVALALLSTFVVRGKKYALPSMSQVAAHVAYLQDILGVPQINDIYWTLCLEIQFYLLFCLLMWAAHALRGQRSLLVVFVPALAIAVLWPLLGLPSWRGSFLPCWHGFLAGMLANWVVTGKMPMSIFTAFALSIGCVAVKANLYGDLRSELFSGACLATAAILFVAGRLGRISTWLSWRPLQFLGSISYSLYLIHNPVSGAGFNLTHRITGRSPMGEAIALIVVVGVTIAAAWVLWRLVERPAQALSQRIRFQHSAGA